MALFLLCLMSSRNYKLKQNPAKSQSINQKNYNLRDVQERIAPFEDMLLAELPTKEEILERGRQRRLKKHVGSSALLLCVALSGYIYWLNPVYHTQYVSTRLGQTQQVELADGSRIQLNTSTTINVNYRLRSKEISLQQGEATFTVKHYPWQFLRPFERRFVVTSGNMQVEDIGTVFNVRQYTPQHSEVIVLQGQVRVSLCDREDIPALDLYALQSAEQINQQLTYRLDTDIDVQTAWYSGNIQFKAIPLSQAITEFQRYQPLDVKFNDSASQNIRISGRFKVDNADQFMQLLPQITTVQTYKDQTGQWIVKTK